MRVRSSAFRVYPLGLETDGPRALVDHVVVVARKFHAVRRRGNGAVR
ncbi:hypothetical protein BQ8482_110209 [Mesorhizobium delmotii]|uniref:Uncharacterized protein n=1 Tax=Mesorhizobium delmotii TaxID=1631247 RepID=A0A2P9AAX6_9HYPH|nr:hypothetical protein BQ8482_110209 [Mesorhizobium delmotii]